MPEKNQNSARADDNQDASAQPRKKKAGIKPEIDDSALMSLAGDAADNLDEVEEGAPLWTLTYGDMMSLLLVFFILLFSMSEIKLAKFAQAAESLREGFGASPKKIEIPKQGAEEDSFAVDQEFEKIQNKIEDFITKTELSTAMNVTYDESELTLQIQDVALFQPASADMFPKNEWLVDKLVEMARDIDVPVIISGHTDSDPINTAMYPSNWELSSARACRVARELVSVGFDPHKVQVIGFAEFRPVDTNETTKGKANNRRIELVYTRQKVEEKLRMEGKI